MGTNERKTSVIVSSYMLSVTEDLKKLFHEDGECRPELIVGRSEILDIEDVCQINKYLGDTTWTPVYSTSLHKRSLSGLYSRFEEIGSPELDNNSPVLILVKDTKNCVFGALVSQGFSDNCSEIQHSVLFHVRPKFETFFTRPGLHECTVSSRYNRLCIANSIGAGGEEIVLWLNHNLTMGGTTEIGHNPEINNGHQQVHRKTSQSLIEEDLHSGPGPKESTFAVKAVECWTFGSNHSWTHTHHARY